MKYYKHNTRLTPYAQKLRKGMTEEERKLWYNFLKVYPIRFLRQKVIDNYIVDFYCASAKLVIEIDGTQHYDGLVEVKDEERDAALRKRGFMVIRFSNRQINQEFRAVCEYIDGMVQERIKSK